MPNDAHEERFGTTRRLLYDHGLHSWRPKEALANAPEVIGSDGVYYTLADGRRVLNLTAGAFHALLGGYDPRLADIQVAIMAKPQPWVTEEQAVLLGKLAEITPHEISSFFLTTSGTETISVALSLACSLQKGRTRFLGLSPSYHGGFGIPLELSANALARFSPGLFTHLIEHIPAPHTFPGTADEQDAQSIEQLEAVLARDGAGSFAAMVIEPIAGSDGVFPLSEHYLRTVSEILRRHGILLISDEIMTGFGRTGVMFACEHTGVTPDMIAIGKGLTAGFVPLYALGVSADIGALFESRGFPAGATFNAYPFGCAVAARVIDIIREDRLVEHAAAMHPRVCEHLADLAARHPSVRDWTSIGLFGSLFLQADRQGAALAYAAPAYREFREFLLNNGLLVSHRHGGVVMIGPPLIITATELAEGFAILDAGLEILDADIE